MRAHLSTLLVPALILSMVGSTSAQGVAPGDKVPATISRCAPDTLAVVANLRYNLNRHNRNLPQDSTRWTAFSAGYLSVRDTAAIRLVTDEAICSHAASVYTRETADSVRGVRRRVTLVRAGDRFVITDPFTPVMAGEYATQLIVDRDWKVLVRLGH